MKRRKRLLRLGLVAAILVGVGATYANTADTASTSDLEVTSQEEAVNIDLDISDSTDVAINGSYNCDGAAMVDNQDTGTDFLLLGDVGPGSAQDRHLCLKNNGTDPLVISSVDITDTASTELACTNDEADEDPDGAGCGTAGELEDDVRVELHASVDVPDRNLCADATSTSPTSEAKLAQTGIADGNYAVTDTGGAFSLAPGATMCVQTILDYSGVDTTVQERVANQTDQLTFRLAFNAEAV